MRTYYIAAVVAISLASMPAAAQSRKATIEDTSGVKTVVTDLRSTSPDEGRYLIQDVLVVKMQDWDAAIPTPMLRSINLVGSAAEVTYDWNGETRTISGGLSGKFSGKSEFGDFTLDGSKVRQLAFDAPPVANPQQKSASGAPASLILTNGTRIELSDLMRYTHFYSTEGYVLGGAWRDRRQPDFVFMRGEALSRVNLDAIAKLDFGPERSVTVTLKSGSAASGKLNVNGGEDDLTGWVGESHGLAFVPGASVRTIEFPVQ